MHGRLSGNGRTVLDVGYRPGAYGIAIQRVALFDLLLAAAINAGVRFETSSRVTDIEPGSAPRLALATGVRTATADLAIDASGRQLAGRREASLPSSATARYGRRFPAVGALTFSVRTSSSNATRGASQMAGVLPVGTARDGAAPDGDVLLSIRNKDFEAGPPGARPGSMRCVPSGLEAEARQSLPSRCTRRQLRGYPTRTPAAGKNVVRSATPGTQRALSFGQGANTASCSTQRHSLPRSPVRQRLARRSCAICSSGRCISTSISCSAVS